eukprot:13074231-Heterocapsa_arctica.AAC.1
MGNSSHADPFGSMAVPDGRPARTYAPVRAAGAPFDFFSSLVLSGLLASSFIACLGSSLKPT